MASKPSKEETYRRDPSPNKIEPLSYCLGDLRDPRTFPHCSRAASSRYSVPTGPSRGARHFLLLVSNMGRFPELTPVRRQTTEAWLPTLGAGDSDILVLLAYRTSCNVISDPCPHSGPPVHMGNLSKGLISARVSHSRCIVQHL